ncbi:MAG: lipopolysaccharide heptosyltransferase II [Gammaproteobacteria bacterium]|nr:lipopolysaccharide heptosyltransferase II [Gammaproteobacteria bacterium]
MSRVLVIAPQWLGDAVMSHALIQLLAEQHTVDVLCAEWLSAVYRRMPHVEQVTGIDLKHGKLPIKYYWQVAQQLKGRYQQCFIIPRKLKSALIPWFAGIPKRTAYLGESRYFLVNDRVQQDPQQHFWVEKVCGLFKSGVKLAELPNPKLIVNEQSKAEWLQRLEIKDRKLIALMPGASYGPSKQWPIENFSQLAQQLASSSTVIVLGGQAEFEIGEAIKQGNAGVINLCGKTSLEDTIDLLALCDSAVSNDSGLMHIAAAVGCFVKALYGSSSPDYTPPLTTSKTIYSDTLGCKPCFKRQCEFNHYDCWRKISVNRVLDES